MGPLNGYTVIELAGIGPAPMGGMILADMGAEVVRIERIGAANPPAMKDVSFRGKKSVVLNLKSAEGVETLLCMVEKADILIDPYRPGVCEKLGIGPDICRQRNPGLIFARMTGWGQEGPLAGAGATLQPYPIRGATRCPAARGGHRCHARRPGFRGTENCAPQRDRCDRLKCRLKAGKERRI